MKLEEKTKRSRRAMTARVLTVFCLILLAFGQAFAQLEKERQADATFGEALKLREQNTVESDKLSIIKLNEALDLYRTAGAKKGEANTLGLLARTYLKLGDRQNALAFSGQALALNKTINYTEGKAAALFLIGDIYLASGEGEKSLEYFHQSLSVSEEAGFVSGENNSVNRIVEVCNALIKKYDDAGDKETAGKFYNQAVGALKEKAKRLLSEAGGDSLLGDIKNEDALKSAETALSIFRNIKDKEWEARTLGTIGRIYQNLGKDKESIEYFNRGLSISREIKYKYGEAYCLSGLGGVLSGQGKYKESVELLKQAWFLSQDVDSRLGASILNSLAIDYYKSGETEKAVEHLNLSLLQNFLLGDKDPANSLGYRRDINDLDLQARSYGNLMVVESSANPSAAVFYGKQALKIIQRRRADTKAFGYDVNVQRSFLTQFEKTYRFLADLLVSQNRLAEAQQVLNAFKDQQSFDLNDISNSLEDNLSESEKQFTAITFSRRENDFALLYSRAEQRILELKDRHEKLTEENDGGGQKDSKEIAELKKVEDDFAFETENFRAVLKKAETEFSKPEAAADKIRSTPDLTAMRAALRTLSESTKQKAVAVYQLVGEENFRALVITADGIRSVSAPVKSSDLNEKAKRLWALLQSDAYDPTPLSKEIYDDVFKPLEKVLPKNARTILWSLDGNLRYVPMAALFDGKKYLVERYNHVNFTRADAKRLTREVKPAWTGFGFGSSNAQTVALSGERMNFNALPGVSEELAGIFKNEKDVLANQKFTRANFLAALKEHRPLAHVASHFAFRAGDEARSFLLLGDGSPFTLAEMKREKDLFAGVELLTLSACNTAAQQGGGGREVDAFFELAQRLGANAVMATLWSVADNSTPALMNDFYDLKLNKHLSKAEALRQAQIALLSGASVAKPAAVRSDSSPVRIVLIDAADAPPPATTRSDVIYLHKQDAPLWDKSKHAAFAHPFYWSPFVLFGNWQ